MKEKKNAEEQEVEVWNRNFWNNDEIMLGFYGEKLKNFRKRNPRR
jgi:hypothetical protein